MAASLLSTRTVAKPWGRRQLWPGFSDPAPGDEPIGEIWFEAADPDPELLVKYLFTSEKLSVQVHPDDGEAQARGHVRGKDEAWLILAAEPDSTIALGPRQALSRERLRQAALDGSIEQLLDWRPVRAGDVIYSPAGTIHAIGAGLTLIEIQQNLDLTYRLYDYGRPRELHLDDAVAVADPSPFSFENGSRELAPWRTLLSAGPAFAIERWWRTAGPVTLPASCRAWLVMVEGEGQIDGAPLQAGQVWLVSGAADLYLGADAVALIAYPGSQLLDLDR